MSKLDEEMANYEGGYSRKLRDWFMELNRTVTLMYPEYEIPWFHDSYCKNEVRLNSAISYYTIIGMFFKKI